jgi:hypothetical protein
VQELQALTGGVPLTMNKLSVTELDHTSLKGLQAGLGKYVPCATRHAMREDSESAAEHAQGVWLGCLEVLVSSSLAQCETPTGDWEDVLPAGRQVATQMVDQWHVHYTEQKTPGDPKPGMHVCIYVEPWMNSNAHVEPWVCMCM